jgi:hypothetical protein
MTLRFRAAIAVAALWVVGCGGSKNGKTPPRVPAAPEDSQPVGVYSYATRGFERLSAVVASRHDYPARSTVTVARTGCGVSERWEPRPERSSEWRFCLDAKRWRLDALLDYHEFFGQAVRQEFACDGPFVPRAPTLPIGFRWTDRCRGAGSRVTVRYEAIREQSIPVGGKPARTVLVRANAVLRGRIDGANRIDSWLSRDNGLLVRRVVRSDTAVDSPFGKIRDRERYALTLRSLTPR